jgi:hypothetical protein
LALKEVVETMYLGVRGREPILEFLRAEREGGGFCVNDGLGPLVTTYRGLPLPL